MNYSTAINVFLTTTETLQALEKGFLPNAASRGLIQLITSQELFEELCVQYINRVKTERTYTGLLLFPQSTCKRKSNHWISYIKRY